jgi:hypothetical protein
MDDRGNINGEETKMADRNRSYIQKNKILMDGKFCKTIPKSVEIDHVLV